jgi:hypothetical protein
MPSEGHKTLKEYVEKSDVEEVSESSVFVYWEQPGHMVVYVDVGAGSAPSGEGIGDLIQREFDLSNTGLEETMITLDIH